MSKGLVLAYQRSRRGDLRGAAEACEAYFTETCSPIAGVEWINFTLDFGDVQGAESAAKIVEQRLESFLARVLISKAAVFRASGNVDAVETELLRAIKLGCVEEEWLIPFAKFVGEERWKKIQRRLRGQ